jgi:hypothetical protein
MTEEVQRKAMNADDWRLQRLINRLPKRIRTSIRFVRQPSRRWLRIPMGLLLMVGGVLSFLPIAGCFQSAWRYLPMMCGSCDRSGLELWIGSNITGQSGWPMDLARNDPS